MDNAQHPFHIVIRRMLVCCFLFVLLACEGANGPVTNQMVGGSEVGNPPVAGTRSVKGHIVVNSDDGAECHVVEVAFIDSRNQITICQVSNTCDFSSTLETDATYSATLSTSSGAAGTQVVFANASGEFDSFYLGSGQEAVNLGDVAFDGDSYVAANDPTLYSDADGDGVVDADDLDDDNDGILDVSEADCDVDGISDDFDLSSSCSSAPKTLATPSSKVVTESLPNVDVTAPETTASELLSEAPDSSDDVTDPDGPNGRTLHPVNDPDGDGRPGKTLHPIKEKERGSGKTLHPVNKSDEESGKTVHPITKPKGRTLHPVESN